MTPEQASTCLLYEKNTGRLVWRLRPTAHFKTDRTRRAWNSRWALKEAGTVKSNGYRYIRVFSRDYLAHRLAFLIVERRWPEEIDHGNRIRCDNRWANLQEVTCAENHQNMSRYRSNRSGTPGVHWCKTVGKWCAKITLHDRRIHIGYYDEKDAAILARKTYED